MDGESLTPGSNIDGIAQALNLINQAINDGNEAVVEAIENMVPSFGGLSATATGGARTLPANPVDFVSITINGVAYKMALYS